MQRKAKHLSAVQYCNAWNKIQPLLQRVTHPSGKIDLHGVRFQQWKGSNKWRRLGCGRKSNLVTGLTVCTSTYLRSKEINKLMIKTSLGKRHNHLTTLAFYIIWKRFRQNIQAIRKQLIRYYCQRRLISNVGRTAKRFIIWGVKYYGYFPGYQKNSLWPGYKRRWDQNSSTIAVVLYERELAEKSQDF